MKQHTFASMVIIASMIFTAKLARADQDVDVCKHACESGQGCNQLNAANIHFTDPIQTLFRAALSPDGRIATYCGRTNVKHAGVMNNYGKQCFSRQQKPNLTGLLEFKIYGTVTADVSKTDANLTKVLFRTSDNFSYLNYDQAGKPINGGDIIYISTTKTIADKRDILFWETTDGTCDSVPFLRQSIDFND